MQRIYIYKQHGHAIFDTSEVDKLKKEIHWLRLKNETLKTEVIEREEMIKRLIATLSDVCEYQNGLFVTRRSHLSQYSQHIQANNRFLPLKETIEDMSETENGDQEEI